MLCCVDLCTKLVHNDFGFELPKLSLFGVNISDPVNEAALRRAPLVLRRVTISQTGKPHYVASNADQFSHLP